MVQNGNLFDLAGFCCRQINSQPMLSLRVLQHLFTSKHAVNRQLSTVKLILSAPARLVLMSMMRIPSNDLFAISGSRIRS